MIDDPAKPPPLTSLHVRRAIEGRSESIDWVVGRLSPLLIAQAAYRLASPLRQIYDPEDLVNDSWLVALPRLGTLQARDGRYTPVLLKFLSTVLLHRINNLLRKHARTGLPDRHRPAGESILGQVPTPHSGVVTQAVRREVRSAVRTCLDELEPRDREVILLRGIEQQTNQTVAVLLQMKPQSVAMRYRRALQRLRARLPGSVFDELSED